MGLTITKEQNILAVKGVIICALVIVYKGKMNKQKE